MARKLITFLGLGNYEDIIVNYRGTKAKPTSYNVEALIEIFCSDWNNEDTIVILATEESKKKHWEGSDLEKENLKERMRRKAIKDKWNYKLMMIPSGKNEEEMQEIFRIIYDVLNQDEEVIIDITHSLRSVSMLGLIVLNYARFLKNITVMNVIYCALTQAAKSENGILEAPLFDLNYYVKLQDWTIGAQQFLTTGNSLLIKKLSDEELNPLLKLTKGTKGTELKNLLKTLEKFQKQVSTSRGAELYETVVSIKELLPRAEKDLEHLPEFVPIYRKIYSEFIDFKVDTEIGAFLDIIKWAIKYDYIQQAVTLMREILINFHMKKKGEEDLYNKEKRTKAASELNCAKSNELKKIWRKIINLRNDINHGGFRPITGRTKARKFKMQAEELVKQM
ncbi:MAG: TIGR02221 family CRISPR-associated protein, partial [Candidatus Heimdallarchaeaceae archaeon]